MTRVLAALLVLVYGIVLALLCLWMINASGLPLCSEGPIADDCIEGTAAERAAGLVLGWAAVLAAFAAVVLAILTLGGRRAGGRLAVAALATPALAVGSLYFLPISF